MADIAGLSIVAAVLGSAALAAGKRVVERRRARRALRERPVLDAATPEGSEVRVTGVVRALDETLEAPLSGRSCVVYRSRIYLRRRFGATAVDANESLRMVTFALERPDGSLVTIDGKHVMLDLDPLKQKYDPARSNRLGLLLGLSIRSLRGAKYEEVIVEHGMRVSIAGLMMKDLSDAPPTGESAFRDAAPPALRIAGDAAHPLAISAAFAD